MVVLDSNIWIAYLNKDDSQHSQASSIFSEIENNILITEYIILEVATVLAMRVDKQIADNFINLVMKNRDIKVLFSSKFFFDKTLSHFLKYKKSNLSFVDISLLALSKNYQIFTLDKELKNEINKKLK